MKKANELYCLDFNKLIFFEKLMKFLVVFTQQIQLFQEIFLLN